MPDVLVTGLPRSGLTGVAALIDCFPNSVCLNEPAWQMLHARYFSDAADYSRWLLEDFSARREQMLLQKPIRDWRRGNGFPLMDSIRDPKQLRDEQGRAIPVYFTKPGLKGDFLLAMKHHTLYTALLPQLVGLGHFTVIAVVRNPVDVILSWQGLTGRRPFMQGRIPPALFPFWPQAARISESKAEVTVRMVQLYDAFCERYHEASKAVRVIKYEDYRDEPQIVGGALGVKTPSAGVLMLEQKQQGRRRDEVDKIKEIIEKYSVFAKHHYHF